MAKDKKKTRRLSGCHFCQVGKMPYWRDYQLLERYLSPRSRILPRAKTGVCAKHQRRLAEAIKHARHLGLLSFVARASQ